MKPVSEILYTKVIVLAKQKACEKYNINYKWPKLIVISTLIPYPSNLNWNWNWIQIVYLIQHSIKSIIYNNETY